MRWIDFRERHPRAHLIVAKRAANGEARDDSDENIALLRKLVAQLQLRGDYAIQEDQGELQLAVETDYDRDRVKTEFSAKSAGSPEDWASRAGFVLDPAVWRTRMASSEMN